MAYVVVSRIELPLPLSARDGQAENKQARTLLSTNKSLALDASPRLPLCIFICLTM